MGEPYDYQLTLRMLLEQGIAVAPKQIMKYGDKVSYTYEEHYARVKKLSNLLKALDVKPGDSIGILEWDTHRFLETLWAVPLYGAMLHTVNVRMSPEQMLYCINHAEDKILIVYEEFLPCLERVKDKLITVKTFIVTNDKGKMPCTTLTNALDYETLLQQESSEYEFPEISENTRATMCYTSGTTGKPKGVVFTHRQLVLHALASVITNGVYPESLKLNGGDVYMPLTPFFHVQAWTVPYFAFMLGMKFVFPGKYEPKLILKYLSQEKVTLSHCVITIFHMIVFHPDAEKFNLRGWKVLLGGGKLNRCLAERAEELGIKCISAYGMTETCPGMALANLKQDLYEIPEEEKMNYRLKSGIPWCFSRMKIVDENFEEVPHDGNSVGQVLVRTPWATQEYFKEPYKTSELWNHGWLNTGDLGTIDKMGYLCITDRLKDAIKSGGEWISTLTLEDVISCHKDVYECAVIGVPDSKWGERPAAYIFLKDNAIVSSEDIHKHLEKFAEEGTISRWWIPDIYIFVKRIPHNFVGKIDKRQLKNLYCV